MKKVIKKTFIVFAIILSFFNSISYINKNINYSYNYINENINYDDINNSINIKYNKLEELNIDDDLLSNERINDDSHDILIGWMISFVIIFGIIITFGLLYLLLFFVFGYWIKINDKAIRVFKIGSKEDKIRLVKMNCMIIYRNKEEIFKSKNDIK